MNREPARSFHVRQCTMVLIFYSYFVRSHFFSALAASVTFPLPFIFPPCGHTAAAASAHLSRIRPRRFGPLPPQDPPPGSDPHSGRPASRIHRYACGTGPPVRWNTQRKRPAAARNRYARTAAPGGRAPKPLKSPVFRSSDARRQDGVKRNRTLGVY